MSSGTHQGKYPVRARGRGAFSFVDSEPATGDCLPSNVRLQDDGNLLPRVL